MTKVISLSDDAYDMLKSLKGEDESFSDVVRTIARKEKRAALLRSFGSAKDNPDFIKAMESVVSNRKGVRLRELPLN